MPTGASAAAIRRSCCWTRSSGAWAAASLRPCGDQLPLARPHPFPRNPEPVGQRHLGVVAEHLPNAIEAGERVAHVAGARRPVLRPHVHPGYVAHELEELVERGAVAGADV